MKLLRTKLPKCLQGLSKKRDASVVVSFGPTTFEVLSYWDGGSKSEYALVNLVTGERRSIAGSSPFREQPKVTVEPNWVLVCTGWFCGKPAMPYITIHVSQLDHGTPIGIVADWLEDNGRSAEAALVRMIA